MAQDETIEPVDALARCPLFVGFGPAELVAAAEACTVRRFPKDAAISIERDSCAGVWVLAHGSVKLHHSARNGQQHIVSFASAPAALPMWAALDGLPQTETATALGPVTGLFFFRSAFLDLLRHRPAMAARAIASLCAELRVRDIGGGVGAFKNARQRLACRLIQLAREFGEPERTGVRIELRLTRRDLANCVGVAQETAIRALSGWQRAGLIHTDDQFIAIHDVSALQTAAGCTDCLFDCSVFGPPLPTGT